MKKSSLPNWLVIQNASAVIFLLFSKRLDCFLDRCLQQHWSVWYHYNQVNINDWNSSALLNFMPLNITTFLFACYWTKQGYQKYQNQAPFITFRFLFELRRYVFVLWKQTFKKPRSSNRIDAYLVTAFLFCLKLSDHLGLVHPLHAHPRNLLVHLLVHRLAKKPSSDFCDHNSFTGFASWVSGRHHLLRRFENVVHSV